jgi:hypothetical protein
MLEEVVAEKVADLTCGLLSLTKEASALCTRFSFVDLVFNGSTVTRSRSHFATAAAESSPDANALLVADLGLDNLSYQGALGDTSSGGACLPRVAEEGRIIYLQPAVLLILEADVGLLPCKPPLMPLDKRS